MDRLFDENILLGNGWTTNESLRPLAYSTLADLVHHARQLLPMSDLTKAIHLFSRNVHDESLPTSIQTMSCKVLLKLAECICQKSEAGDQGRELLLKMLEVFVLKFKTISKLQIPDAHGQMQLLQLLLQLLSPRGKRRACVPPLQPPQAPAVLPPQQH
uniref:Uncharacterized protein n=1 Tax=Timema poppense TaxID=170557 RepID=A0A7R9HD20_TIMPO|nr:unnamed protein product [Timema poppensis]